jgi:hypothetical protein
MFIVSRARAESQIEDFYSYRYKLDGNSVLYSFICASFTVSLSLRDLETRYKSIPKGYGDKKERQKKPARGPAAGYDIRNPTPSAVRRAQDVGYESP